MSELIRNEAEAIDCLKKNRPSSGFYMLQESVDMAIQALEEIQQYRVIGTMEELRELKEKGTAKAPYLFGDGYFNGVPVCDEYNCPNCDESYEVDFDHYDYCPNCGQKLDWRLLNE